MLSPRRYIRFFRQTSELLDPAIFSLETPNTVPEASGQLFPGVFTTFRTLVRMPHSEGSTCTHRTFGFQRHIRRLLSHAQSLGFLEPKLQLHQEEWLKHQTLLHMQEFIQENSLQRTAIKVRLILRPWGSVELFLDCYEPAWCTERAIRVKTVHAERELPELKSTRLSTSRRAQQLAAAEGCDEAFLIDNLGMVREGAWSNIFWLDHDGRLRTCAQGILPGVTREAILEAHECFLGDYSLETLCREASEVFITQSTSGVSAVGMINGILIHQGIPGPRTKQIQAWYEKSVLSATALS